MGTFQWEAMKKKFVHTFLIPFLGLKLLLKDFFYNLYSLPIIIFLLRSVFLVGQMHDIKCLAFCPK